MYYRMLSWVSLDIVTNFWEVQNFTDTSESLMVLKKFPLKIYLPDRKILELLQYITQLATSMWNFQSILPYLIPVHYTKLVHYLNKNNLHKHILVLNSRLVVFILLMNTTLSFYCLAFRIYWGIFIENYSFSAPFFIVFFERGRGELG